MDVFEVLSNQRACRTFTDDAVPDDDVRRILEAATWAPSAENSQPWVFVVVRDPAVRAAVDELARRLWHGGGRDHAATRIGGTPMLDAVDRAVERGFGGAPVLVVVGADTERVHRQALSASIFPAVQNLLLAATALGYGTTLMTLPTMDADGLRTAVALPEHVRPVAVVPLGRPARPLRTPRREPLEAKAHLDRFGEPLAPDDEAS